MTESQVPESVRSRVDAQAVELCADTEVSDAHLPSRLVPLISAARIAEDLSGWWAAHHPWSRTPREDFAAQMFIELAHHVEQVDRQRVAAGASFCGWLRKWGQTVCHQVERAAVGERRTRVRTSVVSLDGLAEEAGVTDPGELEQVRRTAPPRSSGGPDLVAPEVVRGALAGRRGAGRDAVVGQVLKDALGLPPLVRPEDPVEAEKVRRSVAAEPRMARRSLDAARALLDGEGGARTAPEGVLEVMTAMWDSTTAEERQRLAEMPDQVLALHVRDAVRLEPRPAERIRGAVRRAVLTAAPSAPTGLVDDLLAAFWDRETEAVPAHQTNVAADEREQMRERAALSARRLPSLADRAARVPGSHLGASAQGVRTFLFQAWALAEATAQQRQDARRRRQQQELLPLPGWW